MVINYRPYDFNTTLKALRLGEQQSEHNSVLDINVVVAGVAFVIIHVAVMVTFVVFSNVFILFYIFRHTQLLQVVQYKKVVFANGVALHWVHCSVRSVQYTKVLHTVI